MSETHESSDMQPVVAELSTLVDLSPAERLSALLHHRGLVQRVMREAMTEGVHYGIIRDKDGKPVHDRPTLYDPGALLMMFVWGLRGVPVFEVAEESFEPARFVYVVRYELYHMKTGLFVGCGYGAANSYEPQWHYRWMKRADLPPGTDPQQLPRRTVRPRGGGQFELYRTPNQDLTALQNTIRKQAIVRARRDAVLTVTASKDLFTQDLEEIPIAEAVEEMEPEAEAPTESPPASAPSPQAPAKRRAARPSDGRAAGSSAPARPAATPEPAAAPSAQPTPVPAAPAATPQPPAGDGAGERPVLPKEWAQLINEAAKRGWSQPAIAAAYKQVAGKTMDQRPTREEFERLREALSKPGPASTELPF